MSGVPLVSIVMSCYNDAARVPQAVQTILDQTFRELELIVIDDGSTDGTGDILDELAAEDARIRVIHQHNTGLTRALIQGCSDARGRFIARQDSDDLSHPARIAEQLSLLESDERIGFVSCTTQYVGPEDEPLLKISRSSDPQTATRELLHERQGPPAHGSVMFRKAVYERVGGYRSEFLFAQDSDLWLRMAEASWFGFLPETRYTHRREVRSTSGLHQQVQWQFGELGHLCRQARCEGRSEEPFLKEAERLKEKVLAIRRAGLENGGHAAAAAYLLGSQLVQNGDPRARAYLWQVIASQPWHWKAWIRLGQSYMLSPRRGENASQRGKSGA